MAGLTNSYGMNWGDAFLVKVDEYGNQFWQQTYGSDDVDAGYSIVAAHDDGYITTGHTI